MSAIGIEMIFPEGVYVCLHLRMRDRNVFEVKKV